MNNKEPKIITDWDSIPYNVIADGELVSTRLLYKNHNDMKAIIKKTASNLDELMIDIKVHNLSGDDVIECLILIKEEHDR